MAKIKDTYQHWQDENILNQKLKTIKSMVEKRINQIEISKTLGITEKTLIKLKKKYIKVNQAFIDGDLVLKESLMDALYKKAIGFEYEEIQTFIEETSHGQKKKVIKSRKYSLPDVNAIKYLLIIKFGREFNDKKDIIDLMYKKADSQDILWYSESDYEVNDLDFLATKKKKKQNQVS